MREGAALVTLASLCEACGHPYAAHQGWPCEACEDAPCRVFVPAPDAPEAAGAPDALARILREDVEAYAVACILYYGHAISVMTDLEFDTLAERLLELRAWESYPWVEEAMLRAGSGYALDRFPQKYHELAKKKRVTSQVPPATDR